VNERSQPPGEAAKGEEEAPERAGFRAWAEGRELTVEGPGELRELTPALITAGGGIPLLARGELDEVGPGWVLQHVQGSGRGARSSTIVLAEVATASAFIPAMVLRDRAELGGKRPASLPAERWQTVELESVEFNRRYLLAVLAGQDPGLVRELFSPALIAWLTREPPAGFSFELNQGNLTVALPGHLGDAAELDRLLALAGAVRSRIVEEIAEEEGEHADLFRDDEKLREIERGVAEVAWSDPPASVGAAIDAYRRVAARKPGVLIAGLMWAAIVLAVVGGIAALIAGPGIGLVTGLVAAGFGLVAGRWVASHRYRWGRASVSRVGLEAFAREYGRSRGLRLEDRWRFHSEHRHLPMPGFADHVFAGELPGSEGLHGRFVMFGDAAEMRSTGQEMAYTSERPLAASALLVSAEREIDPGAAEGIELPDEYHLEIAGREALLWRPVQGNLVRTAAGSDNFCARASGVLGELLARAARG
jgi:hypothetical protein